MGHGGRGRSKGRDERGGYPPRGNRGGYRGGAHQCSGSNDVYSHWGFHSAGNNDYYGYENQSFQPAVDNYTPFGNYVHGRTYTLADEARNTERHHGNWKSDVPLRHSAVTFVPASTGNLNPVDLFRPLNREMQPEKDEAKISGDSVEENVSQALEPSDTDADIDNICDDLPQTVDMARLDLNITAAKIVTEQELIAETVSEASGFVIDLVGDPNLLPKQEALGRPLSPALSSSSSEEIVFVPRMNRGVRAPVASTRETTKPISKGQPEGSKSRAGTSGSSPSVAREEGLEVRPGPTFKVQVQATAGAAAGDSRIDTAPEDLSVGSHRANDLLETMPGVENNKRNQKSRHRTAPRWKKRDNDEALKDYQENVLAQIRAETAEEGGESSNAMGTRSLGGEGDWLDESDTDEEAEDETAVLKYKRGLWEPEYLQDLDSLDTASEGPRGIVKAVLGKRQRPSGLQYMVTWQDDETGTPVWILAEKLDSSSDHKIREYLNLEEEKIAEGPILSSSSGDDDKYEVEDDEDQDLKLARSLQRAEESGTVADLDLEGIMELDADFALENIKKGKKWKKWGKRGRDGGGKDIDIEDLTPDPGAGRFPSASRVADAYDNFDIMEWERPSLALNPKRKGKGKNVVLSLSDSELEEEIRTSWIRDREKKKARKQEREALRAEGLLGKKAQKTGKRDPKAKFKEGMSMEELKREIQTFLGSPNKSLALPPMDRKNRKTVHQIAMAFELSSKSFGSGRSRFPTLIKTSASGVYEEDGGKVAHIMRTRKFLERPDVSGGRGGGFSRRGGGGAGRGGGTLHHKEGDIVGAGAKELGEDNRGRIMLEKMGYKAGMALGSNSNKGIVVPVAAVVKVGKAGLG